MLKINIDWLIALTIIQYRTINLQAFSQRQSGPPERNMNLWRSLEELNRLTFYVNIRALCVVNSQCAIIVVVVSLVRIKQLNKLQCKNNY